MHFVIEHMLGLGLLWQRSSTKLIHIFFFIIFPEIYNGWQQSIRTKPQCHHNQSGPTVAGPALPHASTRPFTISSTSLSNPLRATAAGPTAFPLPSSQTRGHKSSCKHCCSNKAPEWWSCKKVVLKELPRDIQCEKNNIFLRALCQFAASLLFEDNLRENKRSSPGIHIFLRGIADSEVWTVAQSFLCN